MSKGKWNVLQYSENRWHNLAHLYAFPNYVEIKNDSALWDTEAT